MEEEKNVEVEEEILQKKEENISKEDYLKLKRSNEKKKATIVVLLFAMILIVAVAILFYLTLNNGESSDSGNGQANNGSENTNKQKYDNTFVYDKNGSYGIAYAKGYAEVKKDYYCENAAVCNATNADEVEEVVYFHVTSTESEDLKKAINDWNTGKTDAGLSFKIGSVKNNVISICTYADDFYHGDDTQKSSPEQYADIISVNNEDSSKIISSSESNQITLKLEKLKYSLTTTSDFSTCGTLITKVEVVE